MSQQMQETWRKIPGFSEIYEVSNFGEVRSWGPRAQGRVLKTRPDRHSGYPRVQIYTDNGKHCHAPVHALMAKAFPEKE
ncbi:NUMOD4 domain-containing protein [Streptomyces sp. NPDC056159]|uniref:NUMOD4 domain-containing protein n=1 Tax=Streptomyces sp. NPDC056159 TaxID=3155537 RepID=UPI00342D7292